MLDGVEIPGLGLLDIIEVYEEYDGPRLFACAAETGQLFLAFWLGSSQAQDRWLLVPISPARLDGVRLGSIGLREAATAAEGQWVYEVRVGPVKPARRMDVLAANIPEADLPSPDAKLGDVELAPLMGHPGSQIPHIGPDIFNLILRTADHLGNAIEADYLGEALVGVQAVVRAFGAGPSGTKGRLSGGADAAFTMLALPFQPGSFGVRLKSLETSNMFGHRTRTTDALARFMDVWTTLKPEDVIDKLRGHGPRAALRFSALVRALVRPKVNVSAYWLAPDGSHRFGERTVKNLAVLANALSAVADTFAVSLLEVRGALVGADFDPKLRSFHFNDDQGETYRGTLGDSVEKTEIPMRALASIERRLAVHPVTGEESATFTLMAVTPEIPSISR